MKTFKQFIARHPSIDHEGLPCAIVQRSRNAIPIDKDGLPIAIVERNRRKPIARKSLEESSIDNDWHRTNDNSHIGSSLSDVHDALVHHDTTHPSDTPHLKKFTEDSSDLNHDLLDKHLKGVVHDKHTCGHDVGGLDKAFTRNKLHTDLHVYSGVGFHPGQYAKRHPDGHIRLPAYTSTTIDKGTAKDFASDYHHEDEHGDKHILHLTLRKGQKGKYVAHHSGTPEEHEFVIPRGTKIQVHPKPTYHNSGGSTYHVWHGEVVDH